MTKNTLATLALAAALAGMAIAGSTADPAVRDLGKPQGRTQAAPKPVPLPEITVLLQPGASAALLSTRTGFTAGEAFVAEANAVVFAFADLASTRRALAVLKKDPSVRKAVQTVATQYRPSRFTPDDRYFPAGSGRPGQWYLRRTGAARVDAGVWGAWQSNYAGGNVLVGVVDDGFQWNHPDLTKNWNRTHSFDFGDLDRDPSPRRAEENHGTAVAGLIAARGGNRIGITGIAPRAQLAGLRVDFWTQTNRMFADAILFRSDRIGSPIKIKNHSYGIAAPFIPTELEVDALATSTRVGTVNTFSAGNERGLSGQDSNKKHLQNSPNAIAVAAIGADGKFATYSSFGANVLVTAPSSSANPAFGILTTDRTTKRTGYNGRESFADGDYTYLFGGTSASSPLVAGAIALAEQARPTMDTRLAKHLLVRSSDIVDPFDNTPSSDGGWKENGAGFRFNQNYGFGLLNATRLVEMARRFTSVTPLTTDNSDLQEVGEAVPDGDDDGLSQTFEMTGTSPLEELRVAIKATHPRRGDLEAFLTSPSGTTSRLFIRSASDFESDLDWTFTSNAFWGEIPAGTWTLRILDTQEGEEGTLESYQVVARMGEPIDPNLPLAPSELAADEPTETSLELAWRDNSRNETGFEIQRKAPEGVFQTIGRVAANVTAFSATGLEGATAYAFRVRALRGTNASRWSNVAFGTTLGSSLEAPSDLEISDLTPTTGTLSWTNNAEDATGIAIFLKKGNGDFVEIKALDADATSFDLEGLEADTAYEVIVEARRDEDKAPSEPLAFRTPEEPLGTPSIQPVEDITARTARVDWEYEGPKPNAFLVMLKAPNGDFVEAATVGSDARTANLTNLQPATEYVVKVVARRGSESTESDEETFETPDEAPAAPSNLRSTGAGEDSVELAWNDNSSNETGFTIEAKTGNEDWAEVDTANANATTLTVNGLEPGKTYRFRVRAEGASQPSDWSNEIEVTTQVPLPEAPGLERRNVTSDSVEVFFGAVEHADRYEFQIRKGNGAWAGRSVNPDAWTRIGGLDDDSAYSVRVRAGNARGWSDWTEVSFRTNGVPPRAPSNLRALNVRKFELDLAWNDNSDNEERFIVHVQRPGGDWQWIVTTQANDNNERIKPLHSNTVYRFRVRAQNRWGDSGWSNVIEVRTAR